MQFSKDSGRCVVVYPRPGGRSVHPGLWGGGNAYSTKQESSSGSLQNSGSQLGQWKHMGKSLRTLYQAGREMCGGGPHQAFWWTGFGTPGVI